MKRIVAAVMVCVLLLTTFPAMATGNVRTSGNYAYEIKGNGTITIIKYFWPEKNEDIYIPEMIDGYTVTAIGNEAFAREKKPYSTVSVTLNDNIKTIGEKAFFNANIESINISNSVQHIGEAAFFGCENCQFKLANNHKYFAMIENGLYNKSKKELIAYSWGRTPDAFETSFVIPEGILSIGSYVFANVSINNLSITLPSTLTTIGSYAFADINNPASLSSISTLRGYFPNLKTIGEGAFYDKLIHNCTLKMKAVETIGNYAFYKACMLRDQEKYSLDFAFSPLLKIGENAFDLSGMTTFSHEYIIRIPTQNCSDIGIDNPGLGKYMTSEEDFSPNLTTIPKGLNPQVTSLPDTVTAIDSGAFTEVVEDFHLSDVLNDIAIDAFPKGSTFVVDADSYAELWCSENGFGYTVEGQEDDLSWLN